RWNLEAMTQLIGRILRQPYAEKTGIDALDECYVITHHADTASVVGAIKTGLENDGLGDLVKEIRMNDTPGNTRAARLINRRDRFVDARIYLPQVLWVNGESPRPLDYEEDVLVSID